MDLEQDDLPFKTSPLVRVPLGYDCFPTDQELMYYVGHNNLVEAWPLYQFSDAGNIHHRTPQQLPEEVVVGCRHERYYLITRSFWFPNKDQLVQEVGREGYWEVSKAEKEIYEKGEKIGYKRGIVYYARNAEDGNGSKTERVTPEYCQLRKENDTQPDACVLCKLTNTAEEKEKTEDHRPGWKFCPTDEDLVVHYLEPKNIYQTFCSNVIVEVDFHEDTPMHLQFCLLQLLFPLDSQ